MAGKKQPYGINNIVSWGATVVIIGLLFKIQHWPYGGLFISAGLGTEAFCSFFLGFQRETEEDILTGHEFILNWMKILKANCQQSSAHGDRRRYLNTAALDKMLEDAKIGPELIGSLGDGLRTFGDKV